MLSSDGKPIHQTVNNPSVTNTIGIQSDLEAEQLQIFQLIDSLLSFEACLYHQILPLKLENQQLALGMVDIEDQEALNYIAQFLSYLQLTMVTEPITLETHQTLSSAYLNYKNTFTGTKIQIVSPPKVEPQVQTPLSIDTQTEEINLASDSETEDSSVTDNMLTPLNLMLDGVMLDQVPNIAVEIPSEFTPVERLATLPPKKILVELLGRVITAKIGRLYLERQPYEGKIFWTDNGVLQAQVEKIPLSVFQGVLNELKRFAALPMSKVTEPKQVEKECLYHQKPLLLRSRVMSGDYGEEATIQVLKGSALKFYHQQQMGFLSRDTLETVQKLRCLLNELQERFLPDFELSPQQLEALASLNPLMENLDQQVRVLLSNNSLPENS
jgi:type II secretory ATPase GspE/PulE/Tfp pilus assembly ATPase PilB-like protein